MRFLIPLLFLAACATKPEPPRIPAVVRIPIAQPCRVVIPQAEPLAGDTVELTAPLFDLVKALLVDREQRKALDARKTAALEACQ